MIFLLMLFFVIRSPLFYHECIDARGVGDGYRACFCGGLHGPPG